MAKKYDRLEVIADHKTGIYTQRELAFMHKLSKTMIAKITKGHEKDGANTVAKLADGKHERDKKSDHEVTAIDKAVTKVIHKKEKAEKLDNYLDSGLGIAAKKAVEIMQDEDSGMNDIVGFGKFQLDARKGLGTLAEQSPNQINVQQNNTNEKTAEPIEIVRLTK